MGIDTVSESQATRVRLLGDSPLKIQQVKRLPDSHILSVHLSNTKVSETLRQGLPIQSEGTIRSITLDTDEGPPPGCTVYVHLKRWGFYEVISTQNELHIVFETPALEQRVTVRAENEELQKLLLMLFKLYGTNFIVDQEVQLNEKVTFHLEDVPLKVVVPENVTFPSL